MLSSLPSKTAACPGCWSASVPGRLGSVAPVCSLTAATTAAAVCRPASLSGWSTTASGCPPRTSTVSRTMPMISSIRSTCVATRCSTTSGSHPSPWAQNPAWNSKVCHSARRSWLHEKKLHAGLPSPRL
ncbi:MAG: hypothetical protein HYU66_00470 [Armatimonadetes bacterium]|nr:hypothetical protein [Armatimonadota bacterium]